MDGSGWFDAKMIPDTDRVVIMKGDGGGVVYGNLKAGHKYTLDVGHCRAISRIEFCFMCNGCDFLVSGSAQVTMAPAEQLSFNGGAEISKTPGFGNEGNVTYTPVSFGSGGNVTRMPAGEGNEGIATRGPSGLGAECSVTLQCHTVAFQHCCKFGPTRRPSVGVGSEGSVTRNPKASFPTFANAGNVTREPSKNSTAIARQEGRPSGSDSSGDVASRRNQYWRS
jgi:hypothetical protein